jgi:hypothetical protein
MSQQRNTEAKHPSNRPVHTIRYGVIRAAIWKNVVDNGNVPRDNYNVTFSRGFNDGNQWRDSASFGVDDLLVMAKVANEAHSWIFRRRAIASMTAAPIDAVAAEIHREP